MASIVDHTEVRYRLTGYTDKWTYAPNIVPGQSSVYLPLFPGMNYTIQARNVAVCGATSAWVEVNHTPANPTDAPNDPSGLAAAGMADGVRITLTIGDTRANIMTEVHWAADVSGSPDSTWHALPEFRGGSTVDRKTDGATYWYRARHVDRAGNVSSWIGPVSAKAKSVADGAVTVSGTDLIAPDGTTVLSLSDYVTAVTHASDINNLQSQIDGQIDSYFYEYDPTTANVPASSWTTTALKDQHLGDTFTNVWDGSTSGGSGTAGGSWRWTLSGGVYGWTAISDTATQQALTLAGQAQTTADGKRRTFTATPTVPYDVGDLWVDGSNIYYANTAKGSSGSYAVADWTLSSTVGAKAGTNLQDSAGTTLNDGDIKNSVITISSGGVLSGAGGGTVTLGGIGYTGDPAATKNIFSSGTGAPTGGNPGDTYYQTDTHQSWYNLAGTWTIVSDITQYKTANNTANVGSTAASTVESGAADGAGVVAGTTNIASGALGAVTQDDLADGTTYGRPLLSRLSSGKPLIDFSEAIHRNKNVDNIKDGSTYGRPLLTRLNAGRPTIDFSETIHSNKDIDNIKDGVTYKRTTANEKTGAARGYAAIDASNILVDSAFDFSRSYTNKTQDHIPSGTTALQFKASQQNVLFSQSGGFNEITDPSFSSQDYWSSSGSYLNGYTLPGDGTLVCPTGMAASANLQIQNRDGRDNYALVKVEPGQTVRVSYDITTAATGTVTGTILGVFFKQNGVTICTGAAAYIDPGTYAAVGSDYNAVGVAPSDAAWVLVVARSLGGTSGGNGPVIKNPKLLIEGQTVHLSNGVPAYNTSYVGTVPAALIAQPGRNLIWDPTGHHGSVFWSLGTNWSNYFSADGWVWEHSPTSGTTDDVVSQSSHWIPVSPYYEYVLSGDGYIGGYSSGSLQMDIRTYTSDKSTLVDDLGGPSWSANTGNVFTRKSATVGTLSATAAWAEVRIFTQGLNANAALARNIKLEQGTAASPFSIDLDGAQHLANHTQDDLADGTTYKRTTANEKTGAGRAYTGLDSSGYVALTVPDAYVSDSSVTQHVDAGSVIPDPSGKTWWTNSSGSYPLGNPAQDIVFTIYDVGGSSVGTRTVTATLNSATGTISVSTGSSTGITTSVAYTGNSSTAVLITVTATLSSGKIVKGTASVSSLDLSSSGSAPASGSGK